MIVAFFALLVVGLLLVGAEIFVPGGVLGTFGVIALVAAVVLAFITFSHQTALMVTLGVFGLGGLTLWLWIRFFPRSPLGREMTLSADNAGFDATETGLKALVGRTGVCRTDLRPGGIADIAGRRTDVITEGTMLDKGTTIVVTEVEGNRVVVRRQGA